MARVDRTWYLLFICHLQKSTDSKTFQNGALGLNAPPPVDKVSNLGPVNAVSRLLGATSSVLETPKRSKIA